MQTYQEAVTEAVIAREQSRSLSLKIWDQRQSGTLDQALREKLQEACGMWDSCAVIAVKLAPDLGCFKSARRLAPVDGIAQSVLPNYLSERLSQKRN